MARVTVQLDGVDEALKALNRLRKSMGKKELQKPLREAAKVLVEEARSLAPVSEKVHYRYSTPKLVGRLRAPKGKGVKVATYYPGNLRRSIRVLTFRRSPDVFVGYRTSKGRNKGKGVFRGRRVDGYYALWVERRTPILRRAVETARSKLASEVKVQIAQFLDSVAAKITT